MADLPEGSVVAPYIGSIAKGTPSFAGYFLRDLHKQGRLNMEIVRRVVTDEKIESTFEEIIAAISDTSGTTISEKLARDLETVAIVGSDQN